MLKRIPLGSLEKSPLNERQTDDEDMDGEQFQSLVESIEAVGDVNDPLLVRPLDGGGGYEVIKGSRRVAAAREADGVDDVSCQVKKLDDGEALVRSITDNLDHFKRDVPARDRAAKLSQLWALEGDTANPSPSGLADLLGVNKSTVASWLEPLSDEWEDTFVNPLSGDRQVSEVRTNVFDLPVSKLRAIRKATGGGEAGERLANETVARALTNTQIREVGDHLDDGLTVEEAAAVVDDDDEIELVDVEGPDETEAETATEQEPEPEPDPGPESEPENGDGEADESVTAEPDTGSVESAAAATVDQPHRQTGTVTVSGTGTGGLDAQKGAHKKQSTEDILPDNSESTTTSHRPISFTDETVREQLVDEGKVVTFRWGTQSPGLTEWNAGFGEETRGDVIIASIGEVTPENNDDLAEYRHLSGFETVDEWQETIDDGRGLSSGGHLYLVVEDSR